ncbi:MAG: glycosyltransferase family 9 protein [Rhodopila sp.]
MIETKDLAIYYHNLGVALRMAQRPKGAILSFSRALSLMPDLAAARIALGMAQLSVGDMPEGWSGLVWGWEVLSSPSAVPRWCGEPAEGRTLLIVADELGFGDVLQFCRYVPLAARHFQSVIVKAPDALIRLLRLSFPAVEVQPPGEAIGDMYCPTLCLPRVFGTTLDTVPADVPYLYADPAQVEAWRQRLAAFEGLKIGLCWAGNPRSHIPSCEATDRRRSIAPERLAALVAQAGCHFFSLQKTPPFAPDSFGLTDYMPGMQDFADTAALVSNLDLVISVDSAIAHLAAGLGRSVWLLDRFDCCWRWLLDRTDSPWYPTLQIYRQSKPGDWDGVLSGVRRDLAVLADAAETARAA